MSWDGPLVSVIVPIYNGEKHIRDCVSYLEAQTFRDFETLLCVDVRSGDRSLEVAKECCPSLGRCRVIEQTDGNHLAGNRNAGLDAAAGKYVWFYDVDDAVSPDLIEECVRILEGTPCSAVCFNSENVSAKRPPRDRKRKYSLKVMTGKEASGTWVEEWAPVTAWSKMVRTSLLTENSVRFEDSLAEDIQYTYRLLSVCDRVALYYRPLYAYVKTPNSITRNPDNMDRRGRDEVRMYSQVLSRTEDGASDPSRRDLALMMMRSSGHMTRGTFLDYVGSEDFRKVGEKDLRGNAEYEICRHIPSLYHFMISFYLRFIYMRDGSTHMKVR